MLAAALETQEGFPEAMSFSGEPELQEACKGDKCSRQRKQLVKAVGWEGAGMGLPPHGRDSEPADEFPVPVPPTQSPILLPPLCISCLHFLFRGAVLG